MMQVTVAICTCGRPHSVKDALRQLVAQTLPPDEVLVIATCPEDVPILDPFVGRLNLKVAYAPKGLPIQRNRALDMVHPSSDIVFFIDDDYLPSADAIANLIDCFSRFSGAVGITGTLLADGIHSEGLSQAVAQDILRQRPPVSVPPKATNRGLVGLYGCNMAYRMSAIGSTRFDEDLPLYAWQEDVDFASRIIGEKIKVDSVTGVHCGTKQGRETNGTMLGYSQIANPYHLSKKEVIPTSFLFWLAIKNLAANHCKQFKPEDWIDRRARAKGNRMALKDMLLGNIRPENVLDLHQL